LWYPVAKFIVPEWGILLTPANGCRASLLTYSMKSGGPGQQPYAGVNFISQSGTMNLAKVSRVSTFGRTLYVHYFLITLNIHVS
jgi:hypothetical protein